MKKIVLTSGLIGGLISAAMFFIMALIGHNRISYGTGEVIGYTTIILSFSMVFFGIRSYRENVGNGQITFGKAFKIGILITIIASLIYVISWMIISKTMMPGAMKEIAAMQFEKMKNSGKSAAEIQQAKEMMQMYAGSNVIQFFVSFLEPFPIGLLITLVSSLILKKKKTVTA